MPKVPFRIASPMLARLVDQPFSKSGWIYEEKYDGVRMLAYKEGARVSLISRNSIDRTARYPAIAAEIQKLKPATLVLDGEIVVLDAEKVSRFQMLQQGTGRPVYAVFDCLYADGKDLRQEPLSARREVLEKLVGRSSSLLLSDRLDDDGIAAFRKAAKRGFEGIVAKHLSSTYVEGRSSEWLKVKARHEEEFVIGGYTAPGGSRAHFGALLLGVHDNGSLRYVGKVGTGFNDQTLASLSRKFQPLARKTSPFSEPPKERGVRFIAPKLVAQIAFSEWTSDGKLRQPVYLGLRDDKSPQDVVREGA